MYGSSNLHLEERQYFSGTYFVASDCVIEGDGKFMRSYKNHGDGPNKVVFHRYMLANCSQQFSSAH